MRDLSRLPKVHLHVHLESTVRWRTLREIGDANGVPVPDHLSDCAAFDGFRAFADQNTLIRDCLRTADDFHRIAVEYCKDEAAQGVRYAELTFTAASHGERLGDLEMPLAAVADGLAEGTAAYGIEVGLILDHSRRRPVERAWRTLELARKYDAVIGIGLAGDESHPAAPFAEVMRAARDAGVHRLHHAGEAAGPDSIREAIDLGLAERLGHGIRVLDDPSLVAEMRDRGIPLEVCPSSNVTLGLVPSYDEHPLPRLVDAGLAVSLNTDVPSVTGATLTDEYVRARDAFGYSDAALAAMAHAGVEASYAPADTSARLRAGIDAWLAEAPI